MACFENQPMGRHGQLKSRGLHIMMTYRDGVLGALALAVVSLQVLPAWEDAGNILSRLRSCERHRTPLSAPHSSQLIAWWRAEGAASADGGLGVVRSERTAVCVQTQRTVWPTALNLDYLIRSQIRGSQLSSPTGKPRCTHLVLLGIGHEGTKVLASNDTSLLH